MNQVPQCNRFSVCTLFKWSDKVPFTWSYIHALAMFALVMTREYHCTVFSPIERVVVVFLADSPHSF